MPCGFGKKVRPRTPDVAGFDSAALGERRQRGGGEALPAGWCAGARCLNAWQGHGGLVPGRRATCFVPSLATLSALGRPDGAARASAWTSRSSSALQGPPARDEPQGGLQPPQGTLGSPAEEKPARSLSPPGAAAGRASAAAAQQVRRSLCSFPGSQSFFPHLLHSLPLSVLFGSFFYMIAGQVGRIPYGAFTNT